MAKVLKRKIKLGQRGMGGYIPTKTPVQRNGFRYIPARVIGEEINGRYSERHYNSKVCLSVCDRSPEIELERTERMSASGGRLGYRSIFATHGAEAGNYYFEAEILEGEADSHVRIGFGRMGAKVGGPVGMDCRGFGFCDSGHIVHQAKKIGYSINNWGPGDRIGCQIYLPPSISLPKPRRTVVDYNRQIFFEEPLPDPKIPDLADKLHGSWIRFYVNGVPVTDSPAFVDLPQGIYYPMISLYRGARVKTIFEAANMRLPEGAIAWENTFTEDEVVVSHSPMITAPPQMENVNPAFMDAESTFPDSALWPATITT